MTKTGAKLFRMFVLLCVVLSSAPMAFPQTTTTGSVEGRVHLIGAPDKGIAEATVVVTNEESGLERSFPTNASGNYFFGTLPPGRYTITVTAPGYESQTITNFAVRLSKTNWVIPPIALQTAAVATSQPPVTPPPSRQEQPATATGSGAEQLTDTSNATRGENFDRRILVTLPLPGIRTFDDLAFLAPGVAPPPQAIGHSVGPGVGAGVGTSGQFSVNGLRSRSNNFTVDGSDNNDEDIGVRRQGFTSLVPQSIESLQEFQIITLLPEPQFGRKMGAQVNAVSRSGGTDLHGAAYLFYTNNGLRARDTFDAIGAPATLPLTRSLDGQPIFLESGDTRKSIGTVNPGGRKQNDLERPQLGFVLGGPLAKPNTFFFTSFEHQHIEGTRESHFAVPTVAQRGFFGTTGETGGFVGVTPIFPTSSFGDAFFSLFPFPNDPIGPYGNNTFTELLPIDADGSIFSVKIDQQNIKAFGKDHTLTGRYNFTDDNTILPVTGEALFSSLRALVRTQNLSLIFNSVISPTTSNQFRFSWGTTRLNFREVRDSLLSPSKLGSPIEVPFLLNAPVLFNATLPPGDTIYQVGTTTVEDIVGPLGQFIVSGFSPVGVDVFNFPQQRTNKTYQLADTVLYTLGAMHRFTMGFDTRLVRLNSLLDRNFRPQAVFSSAPNLAFSDPLDEFATSIGSGIGLVGAGAPTGFFQTLTTGPDSRINLRYWQNNFFLTDQIHPRPNITITLGIRYELNTVPTEQDRRIEKTFASDEVKKFIQVERQQNGVSGLETFLAGRTKIFRPDKNNIAPHIAFAWDPFGKGETSIRAGYGIYYDQVPGAVISQSRNVFPSFVTVNTAGFGNFTPDGRKVLKPFNPATVPFGFGNQRERLVLLNTLNRLNPALISRIGGLANLGLFLNTFSGGAGGVAFVLPAADLVTPYAQHWGITVEQQIKRDFLISLAYVGTRGTHLLRSATPNLGPNAIPSISQIAFTLDDPNRDDFEPLVPLASGNFLQPGGRSLVGRPFPLLGAFTSIESDANSTYNALQLQVNKSFSHGIQVTTAYTWSHAIDEVSDIFDLAGASALPQDSFDRRAERGDANFDVRHRFVYSFIWDLPIFSGDKVFGGWQIASIGTFQTGQPYTIIQALDVNLDGNPTDRLNNTEAIKQVHEGSLRFTFDKSLNALSLGSNGVVGRNTFRAPGIVTVDMAVNKHFRFKERHGVEFRSEFFNLFNHSNFGIPVHQVGFPGFGQSVDLRVPRRTVQFGLKYSF